MRRRWTQRRWFSPSDGAAAQPYSLWGLRGPTPRGYFLCEQKVTKKSLEPEVPDLPLGAALWTDRLGGGFAEDWVESLVDWVPRELEILRGSDLGDW